MTQKFHWTGEFRNEPGRLHDFMSLPLQVIAYQNTSELPVHVLEIRHLSDRLIEATDRLPDMATMIGQNLSCIQQQVPFRYCYFGIR